MAFKQILKILLWSPILFFPLAALVIAHQVGKLSEDPWLGSPVEMFENLAFAMALGLGLPFPRLAALLLLLALGWAGFRLGRRLTRWVA